MKISNFSCYYCVIVKSIIFYDETNIHHQKIMFMPNKWIHFNIAELLNRQMDERVLAWILDKILTSGIKIITHRSIRYRTVTHWLIYNKLTVLHVNWNRSQIYKTTWNCGYTTIYNRLQYNIPTNLCWLLAKKNRCWS